LTEAQKKANREARAKWEASPDGIQKMAKFSRRKKGASES
jgi:hypothetical protein